MSRNRKMYSSEYIAGLRGDPVWEAIWRTIKHWDIERGDGEGYATATGDDVTAIYDAIHEAPEAPK